MTAGEIRSIVVAGDAPVAAMAGAALALSLKNSGVRVTIIASPEVDAPVVIFPGGENSLQQLLGIDETLLLGITSVGLGAHYPGLDGGAEDAFVPLGGHGMTLRLVDFHHYVLKLRAAGEAVEYNDYSVPAACAAAGRLVMPGAAQAAMRRTIGYDLYADSREYAECLSTIAIDTGARVVTGDVASIEVGEDGNIESVVTSDGKRIEGDLFVDCSCERHVARGAQGTDDFDDWSSWLPCNRAAWFAADDVAAIGPYMTVREVDEGWHLSVQTRVGALRAELGSDPHGMPPNGNFRRHWQGNCVAIGSAASRIEPIELTPMHLAQASIRQLLTMLPRDADCAAHSTEYNRVMTAKAEDARDYVALRHALLRPRYAAPESLETRMRLFGKRGRFTPTENGIVGKARWVSSFLNLGLWPAEYDPLADMIDVARMRNDLADFRDSVALLVGACSASASEKTKST